MTAEPSPAPGRGAGQVPGSGGAVEYNLADLFESVVDVVPDREALVYADHPGTGAERRLTYGQLDAAANRLAHHLSARGVTCGDHVGLHLYNGVEYLQTVLACL